MKQLMQIIKPAIRPIDLVKYSGASGDFNEVHTVLAKALEKGHPDLLVHGMFLMGWGSRAIEVWFPDRTLLHFKVRFQAPTYVGTHLIILGELVAENSGELIIKEQNGEIKLKGTFDLKEND